MMSLLSVLAVIGAFKLITSEQSPVMEDPLIESFRQQQQLLENIEREMTVKHGEINNKIDSVFRSTFKQTSKISGDVSDLKTILNVLMNAYVKPCPAGYVQNNYGCYKFGLTPVTAYDAKKNCNGQLVTVTSAGEQLALKSLMVKNSVSLDNDYWAASQTPENKFVWGTYDNWDTALDSNILTEQQKNTLRGWFPKQHAFKLLYRATRDGMSPSAFHNKCDGKGPTISIGREATTGTVYGGYTSVSWTGSSRYTSDKNAFIFKLCELSCSSSKYDVKVSRQDKAIYDYVSHGPVFGGGHDLVLFRDHTFSYDTTNKYFNSNGYCHGNGNTFNIVLGCGAYRDVLKWTDVEVHQVLPIGNPAVWDCMVLRGGDQRWETDYCNTKHSYICEA